MDWAIWRKQKEDAMVVAGFSMEVVDEANCVGIDLAKKFGSK